MLAGTHDFDLEVAAAGRPAGVIRGPAWGGRAWVPGRLEDRELAARKPGFAGHEPHVVHNAEAVVTQQARLRWLRSSAGGGTAKTVSGTSRRAVSDLQVAAGDVEHGIDVEVPFTFPEVTERDLLGMSQQPGRLVIEGRAPFFQCTDPQQYAQAAAIGAQPTARGRLASVGLASLGRGRQIAAST